VATGTMGYAFIEGWPVFDALYMTIITLATVGYGEVHQTSGGGRIFTIILIFIGGGYFIYVAGAVVQFMVEGEIRKILGKRKLDRNIKNLKNHYIICGYGRIGSVLSQQLMLNSQVDMVVIEQNPDLVPAMESDGVLYITGDASSEEILQKACINKAKCLVAALATDTLNVFLVLTARQLNPDLFIMARSSYKESESKLRAAGASIVESPYDMGAANMALKLLRPTVTNFLDIALTRQHNKHNEIQMEEIPVGDSSDLVNVMLKDSGIRQKYNLIIIAIKKSDGKMIFNPSYETIFKSGDTVIAVGTDENLDKLESQLNPDKAYEKRFKKAGLKPAGDR
jgi:voltage-gated potassium channel